ncbi:NADP-dependent oxidoreductase [Jatrophihabitans sp. YIM 134969]
MTHAVVLTDFGRPDVLRLTEVPVPEPGPSQIRVAARFSGVGPTDLAIRSGALKAFPTPPGTVLGFETAGIVDAVGSAVTDVAPGDAVAAFLPGLGGYAELVLADFWVRRPTTVSWEDAAALPASGEAAVRVLNQLAVTGSDTLLVLGGTGSVGTIATQVAVARGARVIAAVRRGDFGTAEELGATPVEYGPGLVAAVRRLATVDAVFDAATGSDLAAAVELAGGPERVITLSNHTAVEHGVRLSGPDAAGATAALDEAMARLADGSLTLRSHVAVPLADAASAHARLEAGERTKFLLAI